MRNINKGTKAPYKGVLLTQKEYRKYEKIVEELLPLAQDMIKEMNLQKELVGHGKFTS